MSKDLVNDCEAMLGNSNSRFSGVASTMLQTLEYQSESIQIRVRGKHRLPEHLQHFSIRFFDAVRLLRKPLSDGRKRVFHARRNDEMVQALVLKYLFRSKIKILFTSTAHRNHSKFTRWLICRMDGVISTCQAAVSYLQKTPDAIIPHGVQVHRCTPDSKERGSLEPLTIGMFGRVREQKGTHLLVKACIEVFPRYPGVQANIIGAIRPKDTPWVDELTRSIHAAGLSERILFWGEQPFEELPSLFRQLTALSRK